MRSLLVASGLAITFASFGHVQAAGPQQQPSTASASAAVPQRAVLDRYCVTCHNQKLKTAGLALDTKDVTNVAADAAVWEKAVRKLRAGVMPPAGRPRPDKATYDGLIAWLESELDRAAAARPNPGRTEPFHRLNRAEYQNAIRDLLELDIDVSALLPTDDASYGFDNMAGVLKMSPTLMERYLSAAQKISRLVVGTPALIPNVDTFRIQEDLAQDDRLDGLPFGTRGGTLIHYRFPMDAEYVIQVRLSRLGLTAAPPRTFPDSPSRINSRSVWTASGCSVHPGRRGLPQGKRQDQYQQDRKRSGCGLEGPPAGEGGLPGRCRRVPQEVVRAGRNGAAAVFAPLCRLRRRPALRALPQ